MIGIFMVYIAKVKQHELLNENGGKNHISLEIVKMLILSPKIVKKLEAHFYLRVFRKVY